MGYNGSGLKMPFSLAAVEKGSYLSMGLVTKRPSAASGRFNSGSIMPV